MAWGEPLSVDSLENPSRITPLLHRSHIPAMAFAIPDPVFGIPCSLAGVSKSSEGDSPPMPGNSGFGRHSSQSVSGALVRCSLLFSLLTGNYRGERFVLDWLHSKPPVEYSRSVPSAISPSYLGS